MWLSCALLTRLTCQVYCVPIGGMLVRQPVSVGGSGSSYIYGFMDANYKPHMNKDQCLELTATGRLLQGMLGHGGLWLPVCLTPTCLTPSRCPGNGARRLQRRRGEAGQHL